MSRQSRLPNFNMLLCTAIWLMSSLVCCLAETQAPFEGQEEDETDEDAKRALMVGQVGHVGHVNQISQIKQVSHFSQVQSFVQTCDRCYYVAASTCMNPTTLIVPMNSSQSLYIHCEKPTPYCDSAVAACVSYFPQLYFYCRGDGQFPHFNDCNGSFLCRYGKVIDQPCPEGTHYNHHKRTCSHHKHHCPKINCKNKNGVYVGHPLDESLYILCVAGVVSSMYSCPHGYIFSPGHPDPCVFTCRGEGRYPDYKTPSKFYDCFWTGHKFKMSVLYCPSGFIFSTCDGHVYKCLKTILDCSNPCVESRIPDCRPKCVIFNVCLPPPCAPCSTDKQPPFFIQPRSLNEIDGDDQKTGGYQNETNFDETF